jgi:glucose/arabinose dehydrogenase
MNGHKRWTIGALLLALVLGVGALLTTATTEAAAGPAPASQLATANPVGTWSVTVTVNGMNLPATLHFTPNGRVLVAGRGAGLWVATGATTFSFRLAEGLFTTTNTYVGYLDVTQNATLSGNTYASSGQTSQYDANDALVATVPVTQSGVKV